jgi:hypothetical protein
VGIEDKVVNVYDVTSVINFNGTKAGAGPNSKGFYYDNDLNNNGRKDGDEFEAATVRLAGRSTFTTLPRSSPRWVTPVRHHPRLD